MHLKLNSNLSQPLPGGTKYILQNMMDKLNIISVYQPLLTAKYTHPTFLSACIPQLVLVFP